MAWAQGEYKDIGYIKGDQLMEKRVREFNGKSHALLAAVKSGQMIATEALVRSGASPDIQDEETGDSALHIALAKKNWDMINLLLDCGADITIKNNKDKTPIRHSAEQGYVEGIKLIASKRNTDAEDQADFASALALMVSQDHQETARVLLESGADPDKITYSFKKSAGEISTSNSCLHMAANSGNVEMVRLLLTFGADPNAKNSSNKTPIELASLKSHWSTVTLMANWCSSTPKAIFEMLNENKPLQDDQYSKIAWYKPAVYAYMLRLPLEIKMGVLDHSLDKRHSLYKFFATQRGFLATSENKGFLKRITDEHKIHKIKMVQQLKRKSEECKKIIENTEEVRDHQLLHLASAPPLTPPLSPAPVRSEFYPALINGQLLFQPVYSPPPEAPRGIDTLLGELQALPSPASYSRPLSKQPSAEVEMQPICADM